MSFGAQHNTTHVIVNMSTCRMSVPQLLMCL